MRKLKLLLSAAVAMPLASGMQKLWRGMGNSLPFACQDRAATKAAYRLLSSDRIDEQTLLQGHTEVTCQRIHALEKDTELAKAWIFANLIAAFLIDDVIQPPLVFLP